MWHLFSPADNGVGAVQQVGEHFVEFNASQHRRSLAARLEGFLKVRTDEDVRGTDRKPGVNVLKTFFIAYSLMAVRQNEL